MKVREYLSPTSISLFNKDVEAYYVRYLSDNPPTREPQTQPMSIGSAFDAYIKAYLYERLFGKAALVGSGYERDPLFEEQVDPVNRDWAREAVGPLFQGYLDAGCAANLLKEMSTAAAKPRFEFTLKGEVEGVTLLGKPDLYYINAQGVRVIYDWKVNGFCAKRNVSPAKGYVRLMPGDKIHRDCILGQHNGQTINIAHYLHDVNPSWADQLSIYAWLLGEPVGSEQAIVGIDQAVGRPECVRYATHRVRLNADWQYELLRLAKHVWEVIHSDHIFRDMSKEDSQARCELLDMPDDDEDSWMPSQRSFF